MQKLTHVISQFRVDEETKKTNEEMAEKSDRKPHDLNRIILSKVAKSYREQPIVNGKQTITFTLIYSSHPQSTTGDK